MRMHREAESSDESPALEGIVEGTAPPASDSPDESAASDSPLTTPRSEGVPR